MATPITIIHDPLYDHFVLENNDTYISDIKKAFRKLALPVERLIHVDEHFAGPGLESYRQDQSDQINYFRSFLSLKMQALRHIGRVIDSRKIEATEFYDVLQYTLIVCNMTMNQKNIGRPLSAESIGFEGGKPAWPYADHNLEPKDKDAIKDAHAQLISMRFRFPGFKNGWRERYNAHIRAAGIDRGDDKELYRATLDLWTNAANGLLSKVTPATQKDFLIYESNEAKLSIISASLQSRGWDILSMLNHPKAQFVPPGWGDHFSVFANRVNEAGNLAGLMLEGVEVRVLDDYIKTMIDLDKKVLCAAYWCHCNWYDMVHAGDSNEDWPKPAWEQHSQEHPWAPYLVDVLKDWRQQARTEVRPGMGVIRGTDEFKELAVMEQTMFISLRQGELFHNFSYSVQDALQFMDAKLL